MSKTPVKHAIKTPGKQEKSGMITHARQFAVPHFSRKNFAATQQFLA
jgi:hypothetical protein